MEEGRTHRCGRAASGAGRVELVLDEGRNGQVRRMPEAVGHPVRRLHRLRYAGLEARRLAPGEWGDLPPDEVARLRREAAGNTMKQ